jgi:arabinofuranosyltransferase
MTEGWTRVTDAYGERIRERRTALTVGLYVVAVAAAWAVRFVQDDAFITYRFSRNLARGDGLVFNPGDRVEGYTNFLWTVVHALPEKFGWSTPVFSQILGIATLVAALAGSLRLARRLLGTEERALWAGVVLVATMTFIGYGTGGLETMLQTALVTWIAVLVLGPDATAEVTTQARLGAGVLAGLAVLTRLDSAVLVAAWFAVYLWREWRRSEGRIAPVATRVAHLAAPGLLLVVPWLWWKLEYYGDLLPNTFYAKSAANPLVPMAVGVFYLLLFFFSYAAFLLVGRWRSLGRDFRSLDGAAAALGVAAVWMVYVVLVGADFMEFRFLVPVLPVFAILASFLLDHFRDRRRQMALLSVLLVFSLAHRVFPNGVYPVLSFSELSHWPNESATTWLAMGETLAEAFPGGLDEPGQPLIAVAPLGVISYFSDLPTVDMLGLSDREVAREGRPFPLYYPGHVRMADVDYLIERDVALVVGQPSWEKVDPDRSSYRLSEVVRFYPVADLNDLPTDAEVIEIPLTEDKVWRVIYLTRHDRVDEAIAANGWTTFPIERRCDDADLTGPLLSPEWIDRQGADLTCPDLS